MFHSNGNRRSHGQPYHAKCEYSAARRLKEKNKKVSLVNNNKMSDRIVELVTTRLLQLIKVHSKLTITSMENQKYEHEAIKTCDGNLSSQHTQETNKTSL